MTLKKLTNFPGYLISPDGTIYSDKRKTRKPLSPRNINGYDTVVLTVDGRQYVRYIHKLVAEELLHNDDPENKTEVIHIDGNKRNNAVSNLKWVRKGEGASRYFKSSDTRRNKFDDTRDLPGRVVGEVFNQQTENNESGESLSDRELAGKINRLSKEIFLTKNRYNRKILKLDMEFQKQIRQLKEHYKQDPAKLKKEEKELTQKHQTNREQLQALMQKRINELEAQKSSFFETRKQLNKYFYYNDEYHKITDTGHSLVIRVKDEDGNWTMRSVARIIMEEYLKKPQPTPRHRIGFKDFDHRNIAPINLIWETQKEKAERHKQMFPFRYRSNKPKEEPANFSNSPEKFHDDIVRLKVEGNSYKQVARKLGISYYRLYRYCKRKGI